MSFLSQEDLLSNSVFQIKIRQAMTKGAVAIVGETPSGTARDQKRHDLGVSILHNISTYEESFRRAVVSLGTITSESSDIDFETAVNSVFSDIAGITGTEATL